MKVEIKEGFPETEVIIQCSEVTDEIMKMKGLLVHSFSEKLSGVKDGTTYLISKHDILYFESVDNCSFMYTVDAVYEISLKLYEIEKLFGDIGFFRSKKSQILNIAQIEGLRPDFDSRLEVTMKNGEQLIVSRQYARLLKERLGLR